MWWPDTRAASRGLLRLAGIGVAGGLMAGCFQPLYGDHSFTNTPGIATALAGVDVTQIDARNGSPEARVAVEMRNQLLFDLTGGAAAPPPTHRLTVRMTTSRLSVIVDVTSGRPDVEDYGINVTYQMVELKTGKPVVNGETFARVSYDIPGQEQRFARARALRDSENRAAKLIADNVRTRLASYFVAGT
jgi:LPS-assembly lipoprotein